MKTEPESLDELICRLRCCLQPIQDAAAFPARTRWPVAAIVGCPRSGTTLLLQVLARTGCFSYPTNVLARFAYAPYVGALVQRMLFERAFDPLGELGGGREQREDYVSELGKTKGPLAPNEFHHFFRVQIPHRFPRWLDAAELSKVDCNWIARGLASIEAVFGRPLVTKAGMLQFNLAAFDRGMERFLWIRVRRDPQEIMASILAARESYHGTRDAWWSVQPREHAWLATLDVPHQIAGQVYHTEHALDRELAEVPPERQVVVDYRQLCREPRTSVERIRSALDNLGCPTQAAADLPHHFSPPRRQAVAPADLTALESAYADFVAGRMDHPSLPQHANSAAAP